MGKIKSIGGTNIRKITGGKDPVRLVEEFLVRRGHNPEESLKQRTSELVQWLIPLTNEEDLEVTLESLLRPIESTMYMGINIMSVPLMEMERFMVAALTAADTLIGAKLSVVNYDLVLSSTIYASDITIDDVDFLFELITRQKPHIISMINSSLGRE